MGVAFAAKSLIIVSGSINAAGALSLRTAARELGHNAEVVLINDAALAQRINDADAVVFRISSKMLTRYRALAAELNDDKRAILEASIAAYSKDNMYDVLTRNGLPTPISKVIDRDTSLGDFPVVVKILNGYGGYGVQLLKNKQDFVDYKNEFPNEQKLLIQEYIEESKGTDKRLFVVGSSCVAAMQRVSQTDDFRANVSLGGATEPYQPTAEESACAIAVVKAFGLQFAGVDIISSHRGPLVLEINPSPGFKIQAVSSVDVARLVVEEVLKN